MLPCLSTHGVDCRAHVAVHCTFYLIIHVVRLLMLSTVRMSRVVSAGTRPRARATRERGRRPVGVRRAYRVAPPPVRASSRDARRATRAPRRRRGPRGVQVNVSLSAGLWLFVGNSFRVLWLMPAGRSNLDGRCAPPPARPAARASPRRPPSPAPAYTIFSDVATCPHAYAGRDRWSGGRMMSVPFGDRYRHKSVRERPPRGRARGEVCVTQRVHCCNKRGEPGRRGATTRSCSSGVGAMPPQHSLA